jgi:hypothetical protein
MATRVTVTLADAAHVLATWQPSPGDMLAVPPAPGASVVATWRHADAYQLPPETDHA